MIRKFTVVLGALALTVPFLAFAQGYHLLAPINSLQEVPTNNFAGYAQTLITLIIGLSAVLAVIMIMVGGFMWMGGESVGTKGKGKSFIQHAVGGLVLLLASYLILNTINPQLLNLNLSLPQLAQNPANPGTQPTTPSGSGTDTGHFCYTGNTIIDTQMHCRDTLSECMQEGGKSAHPGTPSIPAGQQTPADGVCYAIAPAPTTPATGGGQVSCNTTTHNCTYTSTAYGGQSLTCMNCAELGIIPMKAGQCAGQTCVAGSEIVGDLESLQQRLDQLHVPWQVTEAWPPTVHHAAPCQANGACVDASPLGANNGATVNVFAKQSNLSGMVAVYEAPSTLALPSGIDNSVVKTAIVPQATGNHFSLYASKADCIAAGYGDSSVCNQ